VIRSSVVDDDPKALRVDVPIALRGMVAEPMVVIAAIVVALAPRTSPTAPLFDAIVPIEMEAFPAIGTELTEIVDMGPSAHVADALVRDRWLISELPKISPIVVFANPRTSARAADTVPTGPKVEDTAPAPCSKPVALLVISPSGIVPTARLGSVPVPLAVID